MVIMNWKLRPKENDPNIFSLKVNDGGGFSYVYGPKRTRAPMRVYKGGNADWFDDVDADVYYVNKFKLIELFIEHPVDKCVIDKSIIDLDQEDNSVIDSLESSNACLETNECEALENEYAGLETYEGEALENDNAGLGTNEGEGIENDNAGLGTQESEGIDNNNVEELDPLFSYPNTNHQKRQSSEHISSLHRNAEGSDDNEESNDTEESEESEDSDFECDIKDRIDDVDADMEMFKKTLILECDLEDFDSDIDPDDDEAERKKLKKRRELYLTKNDKERVRAECRGPVPVFSNSGPSGESVPNVEGPSDGPSNGSSDGPSGSPSQPSEIDSNKKKTKKGGKTVVKTLKCPWLMHSVKPKGENTWYVRVFRDTHTCLQSRKVRKCTASFLAIEIEQSIKPNPKIPLLALKDQIQKKYEIGVSKQKVFRAKQMAQEKVIGDHTTQYSLLRRYVLKLKERNPDTTVKIDVERNFEPDIPTRKFKRIYVCLGALKNGFKAVVESETKQSWLWFLDCLGDDLELFRKSNFTFVTDRQKGVIPALVETFPAAEHRYCLKHIYDNMKLQWKGKLFKELLWRCATATNVTHFNIVMEEVKQANKKVYDWLKDIPPQHWARSHFSKNGLEPGIPETWIAQYHTPIGRPPKKRKKSTAELYDGMVKDGKLSKAGKTVTCTKCVQKGHNSRSCKGQRGGQSTGTPMPNQRGGQRGGQSAQHNTPHSAPHVTVNPSAQSNVTQSTPPLRYSKAIANRLSPAKKTNSSGKRKVGE
ncbi:mutator type transposase [Tanacetum coccineum]